VHTCPNPSCRKEFSAPLKTLNLQQDQTQTYNACPYCLIRINEEPIIESKPEEAPAVVEDKVATQRKNQDSEKPVVCHFHLGYLSERAQKEQIPEECLVCKDIVDCMLRKMRE
jgi:hypothetical protein